MIARTHSFLRTSFILCAAALVYAAMPSAAYGQLDALGAEVRRSPQLDASQGEAITKYVKDHSANLGSDNPQMIRRDRTSLLEPLADEQASPAFRLKFSEALAPTLTTLSGNASEIVVINSLVLAGELATAQGVELLTKALASTKPAVRYQAAFGFRRTFEAMERMTTPTMRADQAESAIKIVTGQISKESDALVVDGLVYASVEASRNAQLRNAAITNLAAAIGERVKQLSGKVAPDQLTQAFLRAIAGARDVLSTVQPGQLSPETMKAASGMAGHLIAYCVRAVESKSLPMADKGTSEVLTRETHAQLATTAENVILLALTQQGSKAPEARKIGDRLKSGSTSGDAGFSADARAIVGSDGLLTKAPFSFPADTFLSK